MKALPELLARVAELERKFAGFARHGTVAEVDPSAGRVRLKLGTSEDGGDFLGPWVPYSQMMGALKAHIPPSVGQQFTMLSPGGDWRQAVAVPMTQSSANGSPSAAGDENVITYGDVEMKLRSGEVEITVGGSSFKIEDGGVTIKSGGVTWALTGGGEATDGGSVTHNSKNIGDTHKHTGVMSGPSLTGPPA